MALYLKIQTSEMENLAVVETRKKILYKNFNPPKGNAVKPETIKKNYDEALISYKADLDSSETLSPALSRIHHIGVYNSNEGENGKLHLFEGNENQLIMEFISFLLNEANKYNPIVTYNGYFDTSFIFSRAMFNGLLTPEAVEMIQKKFKWHIDMKELLSNSKYMNMDFYSMVFLKFGITLDKWESAKEFSIDKPKYNKDGSQMTYSDFLISVTKAWLRYLILLFKKEDDAFMSNIILYGKEILEREPVEIPSIVENSEPIKEQDNKDSLPPKLPNGQVIKEGESPTQPSNKEVKEIKEKVKKVKVPKGAVIKEGEVLPKKEAPKDDLESL